MVRMLTDTFFIDFLFIFWALAHAHKFLRIIGLIGWAFSTFFHLTIRKHVITFLTVTFFIIFIVFGMITTDWLAFTYFVVEHGIHGTFLAFSHNSVVSFITDTMAIFIVFIIHTGRQTEAIAFIKQTIRFNRYWRGRTFFSAHVIKNIRKL